LPLTKLPKLLRRSGIWIRATNLLRDSETGLPQQTGALVWRSRGGKLQLLLITGRLSKRWSIPKGWPMFGKSLAEAAAQEAFEEAGVEGAAAPEPLGRFDHVKTHGLLGPLEVTVLVYPLRAGRVLSRWPEKEERERCWVSPKRAAKLVDNDQLRDILIGFKPPADGR
jgi:8-oxo-dGTP pyrophosphatase MutT (NUDIX family)